MCPSFVRQLRWALMSLSARNFLPGEHVINPALGRFGDFPLSVVRYRRHVISHRLEVRLSVIGCLWYVIERVLSGSRAYYHNLRHRRYSSYIHVAGQSLDASSSPHLKDCRWGWVLTLKTSVRPGQGVSTLMQMVVKARDRWRARVSTAVLNRWLRKIVFLHPPPRDPTTGSSCTLKYLTQVKRGPPEFRVFVNHMSLSEDYQR